MVVLFRFYSLPGKKKKKERKEGEKVLSFFI